jgi:hypothetical protein
MKVAIVGGGVSGLLVAKFFDELGASFTIFSENLSGEKFQNHPLNFKEITEMYHQSVHQIPYKVERVYKSNLQLSEEIPGKSRLEDLFRVVYETPEYEGFADFDLVCWCTGHNQLPHYFGPGGVLCLGEKRVRLKGGVKIIDKNNLSININDILSSEVQKNPPQKIGLVGSSLRTKKFFEENLSWALENKGRKLIWVTFDSPQNVEKFLSQNNIYQEYFKKYVEEKSLYPEKLKEWEELDDFVKVKIKRPQLPVPQVEVITEASVTSLDMFDDREGVFLTLNWPAFRLQDLNPKNHYLLPPHLFKTYEFDFIFSGDFKVDSEPFSGLVKDEVGFFRFDQCESIEEIERNIVLMKSKIDQYFSLRTESPNMKGFPT